VARANTERKQLDFTLAEWLWFQRCGNTHTYYFFAHEEMLNMILKWKISRYFLGRYREIFISLPPQIKNPLSQ
jgi:hypothetical protein